MLVALEGIDGSGTTTQAKRLIEALATRGVDAHSTAEPSEGPVGELIRRVLRRELRLDDRALALLFAADRLDHLEREIQPEIDSGKVVVSDRYLLSSLAYQSLAAPLDFVRTINRDARRPDLSILLKLAPELAATRRDARGGEPEHFDAMEQQRAIAAAYDAAATLEDIGPVYVVDAGLTEETITEALLDILAPHLPGAP